ncbi:galactose-3-O-sulfotransferase 2-like [Oscarella lobularis]|uniref:galactose-3-O-sulfotransferase 2-like n=1 Tax=Oscarella lobularis TaxID=121494 RepID=UPI0033140FB1
MGLLFLVFSIAVNYFTWISMKTNSAESVTASSIQKHTSARRMLLFLREMLLSSGVKLIEPVRKYAYIKTHKTGSTTLWYVMKIYAINNGLRRVEARDKVHLGYPRHLQLNNSRMYRQTHKVGEYDTLYDHCRFNKSVMDKLLNKPAYITILRHPITRFVSAFYFHGRYRLLVGNETSAGQFLSEIDKYKKRVNRFAKWAGFNGMAFDLGIDPPYKDEDVERKIAEVDESFTVVLIMEYMPESMVLLKRTMGWELDDVIAVPQNSHPELVSKSGSSTDKYTAHHTDDSLDKKQKDTLAQLSHADMKIYHHFNATFWKRVQAEFRFKEEVQLYQKKLERYLKKREKKGLLEKDVILGKLKLPDKALSASKNSN